MKTNQPIKRHEALVAFSKDHHFGLLLVWKIRQGLAMSIEPGRISNYVIYCFEEDLRHHFKEEEQMMFIKLPKDDVLRRQAEKEHGILYYLIEKITADKANKSLLTAFAETLQQHIRFEERILFNHLQNNLDAAGLATIAAYQGTPGGDVDSRWQDIFWVRET